MSTVSQATRYLNQFQADLPMVYGDTESAFDFHDLLPADRSFRVDRYGFMIISPDLRRFLELDLVESEVERQRQFKVVCNSMYGSTGLGTTEPEVEVDQQSRWDEQCRREGRNLIYNYRQFRAVNRQLSN